MIGHWTHRTPTIINFFTFGRSQKFTWSIKTRTRTTRRTTITITTATTTGIEIEKNKKIREMIAF